jgi:hypothetical protein
MERHPMNNVRVIQHISAACRTSHMNIARDLPAAHILMAMDDTHQQACLQGSKHHVTVFLFMLIAIPGLLAVIFGDTMSDFLSDVVLASAVSGIAYAFTILYKYGIIYIFIPVAVGFAYLAYRQYTHKYVKQVQIENDKRLQKWRDPKRRSYIPSVDDLQYLIPSTVRISSFRQMSARALSRTFSRRFSFSNIPAGASDADRWQQMNRPRGMTDALDDVINDFESQPIENFLYQLNVPYTVMKMCPYLFAQFVNHSHTPVFNRFYGINEAPTAQTYMRQEDGFKVFHNDARGQVPEVLKYRSNLVDSVFQQNLNVYNLVAKKSTRELSMVSDLQKVARAANQAAEAIGGARMMGLERPHLVTNVMKMVELEDLETSRLESNVQPKDASSSRMQMADDYNDSFNFDFDEPKVAYSNRAQSATPMYAVDEYNESFEFNYEDLKTEKERNDSTFAEDNDAYMNYLGYSSTSAAPQTVAHALAESHTVSHTVAPAPATWQPEAVSADSEEDGFEAFGFLADVPSISPTRSKHLAATKRDTMVVTEPDEVEAITYEDKNAPLMAAEAYVIDSDDDDEEIGVAGGGLSTVNSPAHIVHKTSTQTTSAASAVESIRSLVSDIGKDLGDTSVGRDVHDVRNVTTVAADPAPADPAPVLAESSSAIQFAPPLPALGGPLNRISEDVESSYRPTDSSNRFSEQEHRYTDQWSARPSTAAVRDAGESYGIPLYSAGATASQADANIEASEAIDSYVSTGASIIGDSTYSSISAPLPHPDPTPAPAPATEPESEGDTNTSTIQGANIFGDFTYGRNDEEQEGDDHGDGYYEENYDDYYDEARDTSGSNDYSGYN